MNSIIRISVLLLSVLLFIHGCNELISQWSGTHKLRKLDLGQSLVSGVGDADYVSFTGACPQAPPKRTSSPGYPSGSVEFFFVNPCTGMPLGSDRPFRLFAWKFVEKQVRMSSKRAVAYGDTLTGMIRRPPDPLAIAALGEEANEEGKVIFLQIDQHPIPWYWYALGMFAALAIFAGTEWLFQKIEHHKNE